MGMKRRSNDLIISQILEICENGAGKTRIVYQANLNSIKVTQYLTNLIKSGLVAEIPQGSRVLFKTTFKGTEFRKRYEQLQSEMDELNSAIFEIPAL